MRGFTYLTHFSKKAAILLLIFVLGGSHFAYAEANLKDLIEENAQEYEGRQYEERREAAIQDQIDLLKGLKKRLRHSKFELEKLSDSISEFEFQVIEYDERIDSLDKQVANLDSQIERTEDKIFNVSKQIEVKELEMAELYEQLEMRQIQIDEQLSILKEYLTFLYYQDSTFYDNRSREFNMFKLLLDDDRFSENMSNITYLRLFEEKGIELIGRLSQLEEALILQKEEIEVAKKSLKILRLTLEENKTNLEAMKQGKITLLEQTKGKQEIFEQLIAAENAQEEQIAEEISLLSLNIHVFDSTLEKLKEAGNLEEIEEAFKIRDDLLELQEQGVRELSLGDGFTPLDWPISPYRGLTAYFDDPGYASRFGVPHRALDIRAPQGSPIFASQDGIVYTAHGKGSDDIGYHYVILTHRGGLQTLYGHLSKIIVSEGQFVRKGDIIALSGGIPGTTGAGLRTTGPHLHFEVHEFGGRADPLNFLPLSPIPLKYIPEDKLELLYEQEFRMDYDEESDITNVRVKDKDGAEAIEVESDTSNEDDGLDEFIEKELYWRKDPNTEEDSN